MAQKQPSRKKLQGKNQAYHTKIVAVLSSQLGTKQLLGFDTDGTTAITDNLANLHIFNDKHLYVGDMIPIDLNIGVATIGGIAHHPESIGISQHFLKL
eukprot:9482722-Ditylum_brightwellii.AAC.1